MIRTPREPETDERRTQREAQERRQREHRIAEENRELDAAVRRSISLFGA